MTATVNSFPHFFNQLSGGHAPHRWQEALGNDPTPRNRLIRVPTGLGKTLGALLAWAYHRLDRNNPRWPRRLVWCLPMRTLVEQTAREARAVLQRAGLADDVGVHLLMGGVELQPWWLEPEKPAVLVGTQDMLFSRALNRGYASPRGRWPVEYGLLHTDTLWVMDEVQLMGVALATSEQLQVFRELNAAQREKTATAGPPHAATWWMSATLRPEWWSSVDWNPTGGDELRQHMLAVSEDQRQGKAWEARKPVTVESIAAKDAKALAQRILRAHRETDANESGRVTLAIHNTVDRATATFDALQKLLKEEEDLGSPELRLIHSRFRGAEREAWSQEFLSKKHCNTAADRIIVATQVIEAGVDISATVLVTELAPWPSLVQRLGRAARYGGSADVTVIDHGFTGKETLPYEEAELDAARTAIEELKDAGLASLERFERDLEAENPQRLEQLYPYGPLHRLTRRECDELFDTSPDLTGADLDISRFVRDDEERDVQVFWNDPAKDEKGRPQPPAERQPRREELCSVPISHKWLERLMPSDGKPSHGWVWDYLDSQWQPLRRRDQLVPGRVVLVNRAAGGYDPRKGFTGDHRDVPEALDDAEPAATEAGNRDLADAGQEGEQSSQEETWKTVLTHSWQVTQQVTELAIELALPQQHEALLGLAARLHDWGKTHHAFAACLKSLPQTDPPDSRSYWAKAPKDRWVVFHQMYKLPDGRRRGFRHELASALALFELLARVEPDHPALLGPHRPLLDQLAWQRPDLDPLPPEAEPLAAELAALTAEDFDLLAYLVCAHHGKVRGAFQATPHDQDFPVPDGEQAFEGGGPSGGPLRGIREGDTLPATELPAADGSSLYVPAVTLHLDPASLGLSHRYGASWAERVAGLVGHHGPGPFTLAYLEALIQAADKRASEKHKADLDPLLRTDSTEGGSQ